MGVNRLLVICGPTATGKTSLAIKLAQKFNGEIVSADSRQVYQGMDIGTGKDIPKISNFQFLISNKFKISNLRFKNFLTSNLKPQTSNSVSVWLLNLVSPKYRFNVADWLKCAQIVIADIWRRGKLPIIVGGTGFYIKVLIDGIDSLRIPADEGLRKRLEGLSVAQLKRRVEKLAPEVYKQMNKSDKNNPRRLIRKIEILKKQNLKITKTRPSISYLPADATSPKSCTYRCWRAHQALQAGKLKAVSYLQIGLTADRKKIYKRIDRRVKERLRDGLLNEIKRLLKSGINWDDPGMNCLAYKEFRPYFEEKISLEKAVERWRFDEHKYARKQLTWFKKDKRIKWLDITKKDYKKKVFALVKKFVN